MKTKWIIFCLVPFLTSMAFAQDFSITIDAQKDAFYNTLTGPDDGWLWIPSKAYNANGAPQDDLDCSANWFSAWDDTYLYAYVEVTDDFVNQNQGTNYWANDDFDAKIDPDLGVAGTNGVFCFAMTCMDSADVTPGLYGGISDLVQTIGGGWPDTTKRPTRADWARLLLDQGYVCECRVKWDWVATGPTPLKGPIVPAVGDLYGFAVSIHDNDAATRQASIQWAAVLNDNVYTNTESHGTIELLADHKIKYIPQNSRVPANVNPHPEWYIPGATAISQKSTVVKDFALSQNYPNPFNPATTISYTLQKRSDVKIRVYDLLGNEVATLVNGMKQAGTHTAKFDGSNLSSGIYYYTLQSEGKVITKKMALLK